MKILVRILLLFVFILLYWSFYLFNFPNALNSRETTLLINAIKNNDNEAFYSLVETEDLEIKDGYGYAPLSIAIDTINYNFVKKLIAKGANVNARSDNCGSPVIKTAAASVCYPRFNRNKEIALDTVRLLIKNGADINARNCVGRTALLTAVDCSEKDLVDLLLSNGANANVLTNGNILPLHQAIYMSRKNESLEIIKSLIEAGANPYVKNSEKEYGKTAIELAEEYKDKQLLRILMQSKSKIAPFPYIDKRNIITTEARRAESILYQYGVIFPVASINYIAKISSIFIILPMFISFILGLFIKDKFLVNIAYLQGIIIFGVPILILLGSNGS